MLGKASEAEPSTGNARFTTTHWSVVLAARDGDTTASAQALESLCRTYWPPIDAFLRREGHRAAEAEDLTQAFFAHLLEVDFLHHLRHREGKFRSFLVTFLKHFLSDQRDKAAALKRGGGRTFLPLDAFASEDALAVASLGTLAPDQAFERRWADIVMARAVERLGNEYAAEGKSRFTTN